MATGPSLRILTLISSMECGGAERVVALLCNHWSSDHDVRLATFDDGTVPPFFPLRPSISVVALDLRRVSRSAVEAVVANVRRLRVVREQIRAYRPDIALSFGDQTNVVTLLAAVGTGVPVVVGETSDPRNFHPGAAWAALRALSYRRAARIVLLAEQGREFFSGRLRERVEVIPNPAPLRSSGGAVMPGQASDDEPVPLVTVGRLVPVKGHDILLDALAALPGALAARWRLTVVGDGPERKRLEALADELGLANRVEWVGRQPDPFRFLEQAEVFVLPSRFEGFPMALVEAMSLGRAAIAADCRSGPRELIDDGVNGLLVPVEDAGALADALARLIEDRALRARLGARASDVRERLDIETISERWMTMFARVLGGTTRS